VVEHLVARGDAPRALTLLRRPGTPRELTYKFAPALMAAAPDATVDAWLQAQPPLDPRCAAPRGAGRARPPSVTRLPVCSCARSGSCPQSTTCTTATTVA
jgi:hypothetical protein